ncbi:MAG TPA: signal recognition particle-docking protein FtsY [Candidatus Limnocylindrales bacterium]|nr:signal recognition particle-docking protein FtsY [Candidatus Limnocylindrales bacterium]
MRFFRRRPEDEPPEAQPAEEAPRQPAEEAEAQPPDAARNADAVEPDAPGDVAPSLDDGLRRTRGGFMSRLRGILGAAGEEGPAWDDVEETLIAGDVGPALAIDVVEAARAARDPEGSQHAVQAELARRLVARDPDWSLDAGRSADGPAVVIVVGVNGTGKTTTIGKLAWLERSAGRRVVLAASDTFRAAAIEQLQAWGRRVGADVVAHHPGADPSATVYDALDAGVARGADVVLADTAGRLHTKVNLMDELAKIRRTVAKRLPGTEPETLFVLDATTGQNGLAQAKAFHDAVGLSGIVLTKLDSTAKGGIVFAIEDQLGVPVRFVGVGERPSDILPFDPDAFVAALFG